MDESSVAPSVSLEHSDFPHLTSLEWQALHRLAAVSGEIIVASIVTGLERTFTSSHARLRKTQAQVLGIK